jgi:4-diphosphocytidyl-2-C-methyl-D-erythritol kinase
MGITLSAMPFDVLAPAKVNLFLNITGRRDDGYHLLESLFVFTELADRIDGWHSELPHFHVSGEFAGEVTADQHNLVMKACEIIRRESGVTRVLSFCLEKYIPVAAGLGGGSADAAAMLKALNDYWELGWPTAKLAVLASELGADVPACLSERAVIARGIGDELSPAPALPEFSLLLANPRVPTSTPDVFRAFVCANATITPRNLPPLPQAWATVDEMAADFTLRGNDLLPAALAVAPAIGEVLEALQSVGNSPYAGLSGSGATCFAILPDDDAAAEAGERLHHDHPGWWFWWPGKIIG